MSFLYNDTTFDRYVKCYCIYLYIISFILMHFSFLIYQTDVVPLFFRAGLRLANLLVPLLRRIRQE